MNSCIKEPHSYLAVFVMQRDGNARLDFIQNMEYKFVELLACNFQASPEEVVRQQITFRYNSVKSRLALMQGRLQDINALVKVKSPALLLQLHKAPPRAGSRR
uniref:Spindle assembly abnormal protein 6 N-terminal domain-containing protein n=1 Tax=Spumella elongata TaxID=89044 RepID=A0A7S3GQY0_9STRA